MPPFNLLKRYLADSLPLLLGIALLIYVLVRICNVAITDDEYMSLYYHIKYGFLSIFTTGNPNLDWTANNHVLNSLCMKLGMTVFGEYDWAVRWQCAVAFVMSYFFIWKIISSFTTNTWRVSIYLSVFFLNAYLLEFFALARGYCISIAGWSMAMYFFLKFCEKNEKRTLVLCLVGLFISVYGNFSAIYLLLLFGIAIVFEIYKNKKSQNAENYFLILISGYILITGIIALPLLHTLHSSEISSGGSESLFKDYFVSYIDQYIYFNWRINKNGTIGLESLHQKEIYAAGLLIIWVLIQFFSRRFISNTNLKLVQAQTLFQTVGLIIIFKIFYAAFHTPFPINRSALLFSFPMILCGIAGFERIAQRYKYIQLSFLLLVPFLLWHSYMCFNIKYSTEWWRAGDAKEVLKYVKDVYATDKTTKPITIGAEGWQHGGIDGERRPSYWRWRWNHVGTMLPRAAVHRRCLRREPALGKRIPR